MQLHYLQVNKIKPDINQPRKHFSEKRLRDMAQSMKGEGVVMPVEVDGKNVIICGEMRWRAAKIAGLKEIPCIVNKNKLSPSERLLRQCVENAHHSDMTVLDIARAWKELLTSPGTVKRKGERYSGSTWLAERLGVTVSTISVIISTIEEPSYVRKVLEDPDSDYGYTWFRGANALKDPKLVEKIKRKIVAGDFKSRDDVDQATRALKIHPESAEKILSSFVKGETGRTLEGAVSKLPVVLAEEPAHPNTLANRADMYIFRLERDLDVIFEILPKAGKKQQLRVLVGLQRLHKKIGDKLKKK